MSSESIDILFERNKTETSLVKETQHIVSYSDVIEVTVNVIDKSNLTNLCNMKIYFLLRFINCIKKYIYIVV